LATKLRLVGADTKIKDRYIYYMLYKLTAFRCMYSATSIKSIVLESLLLVHPSLTHFALLIILKHSPVPLIISLTPFIFYVINKPNKRDDPKTPVSIREVIPNVKYP